MNGQWWEGVCDYNTSHIVEGYEPPPNKKYFLGIMCFFKNEGNTLFEWLSHYKNWGIDHIWLIDNGSEDNYDVKEFVDSGFVTIFEELELLQEDSYKKYLKEIKDLVNWLGVFDSDEFVYSTKYDCLKTAIKSNFLGNSMVGIPSKIFYPATLEDSQSIIESNTLVKLIEQPKFNKFFYNLDVVDRVEIHGFMDIGRIDLAAFQNILMMNHYRYGSWEYFKGIKEGRGCPVPEDYQGLDKYYIKSSIVDLFYLHRDKNIDFVYPEDTALKDLSKSLIQKCNSKYIPKPKTDLYPYTSWQYFLENFQDEYLRYRKNKTLTLSEIRELNNLFCDVIGPLIYNQFAERKY